MRNKIYYYNLIAIFLFLVLLAGMGLLFRLNSQVANYKSLVNRLSMVDQTFIKLTHIQFAFFHTKEITYKKQYQDLLQTFYSLLQKPMQYELLGFTIDLPAEGSILIDPKNLQQYRLIFALTQEYIATIHAVFEDQQILGLDHHKGLYGLLRDKVHRLEERLKSYRDQDLLIRMLTMRRHEKDFMLRGLPKYVASLHDEMKHFKEKLRSSSYADKGVLLEYAKAYIDTFDSFVKYYDIIGYGSVSGLIQHSQILRDAFSQSSHTILSTLEKEIQPYENRIQLITIILLVDAIFLVLIIMLSRREVEHAKERNPITGLNGNNRINEHLKKIARLRKKRTIIYFDFDYFKPFNDHFGFKIGDRVIQEFALMLKKYYDKKHNFIGHIGGDDFVVILHKCSFKDALNGVRKLQNDFYQACLPYYSHEEQKRGFSIQKDRFGERRHLPLLRVSASMIHIRKDVDIKDQNSISHILSILKSTAKVHGLAAVSLL